MMGLFSGNKHSFVQSCAKCVNHALTFGKVHLIDLHFLNAPIERQIVTAIISGGQRIVSFAEVVQRCTHSDNAARECHRSNTEVLTQAPEALLEPANDALNE